MGWTDHHHHQFRQRKGRRCQGGKRGVQSLCQGEVDHKTVLCPERVCGGKGHSVEICANNVVVLLFLRTTLTRVRVSDVVKVLSNKKEVFVLDTPGKPCHEYNDGVGSALAWPMGYDLPVTCDKGASCHMYHSSVGTLNYRYANTTIRSASGLRYIRSRVMVATL